MSYVSSNSALFSKGASARFAREGYHSSRDALSTITLSASHSIYNLGITNFDGVVAASRTAKRQDVLTVWLANILGQLASGSIDVGTARALEHSYKLILYFVEESLKSPAEHVNKISPWCFEEPSTIDALAKQQLAELSRCYPSTTKRLCSFLQAAHGWDGADGQPANIRTFNDVKELLICALCNDLREPEVVLGNDGSIGVVWTGSGWYIAHDFDGSGSYIVVAMRKSDVAASGVEKVSGFSTDVLPILTKYFMDDDRPNLR